MADALHHSAAARFCLCNRIFDSSAAVGAAHRRARINSGESFSYQHPNAAWLANGRNVQYPDAVLVRHLGQRTVDLRLDWIGFVAGCSRGLRECDHSHGSLGDVHVDRPHRANLVWVRLGDPTAGNRVFVDLSVSFARRPPVSQMPAANLRFLAFSLARFSDHDWRGSNQTARRHLLARSNLSLLSLRNTAHPESDQSLSAFRAGLVSQIRSGLEPFRRIDRAVVLVRPAHCAAHRRDLVGQFSNGSDH